MLLLVGLLHLVTVLVLSRIRRQRIESGRIDADRLAPVSAAHPPAPPAPIRR